MNLNSKHHVWSPAEYHPKSKVCRLQPNAVGQFFSSSDWGVYQRQSRKKLNAPKYWDDENTVQSTQNLRLHRMFTFQQDSDPKHTARVAFRQLCECPWVAQPEPVLEPNQIFLEKPENVHLPQSNLTELETRRRMVDNCQIWMCKACRIIPQKTWGCKGASAKCWFKSMKTHAM